MSVAPLNVQERTSATSKPHGRWVAGRALLWLAAFSATALLVLPKGLSVFAGLLVPATLLALPDAFRADRARLPKTIPVLAAVAAVVLLVSAVSAVTTGRGWDALDNPSRLLLLPWCAWLAWVYRLRASSLGWGALAGLAVAFAISAVQAGQGVGRVGGEANPIVFANAVLSLLVVALFCRPRQLPRFATQCLLALGLALAVVAITLSGSRGVLPGLALVVLVALVGGRRWRWMKVAGAAVVLVTASVLVWNVSWLSSKFRLDEVHADVEGYATGDVDTPVGARLALLSLSWDVFRESPLSGAGIDGFEARVASTAYCQAGPRHFCGLGHAHNDLAQWAATMGIPGVVALLALYLVPFLLAARRRRHAAGAASAGASWACALLVVTYAMSGATQSMFSHALTTSVYAVFVGLLLGIASQDGRKARAPAMRDRAADVERKVPVRHA